MKIVKFLDALGFGIFIALIAMAFIVGIIFIVVWAVSSDYWLLISILLCGGIAGGFAGMDYYKNPPEKKYNANPS